MSDLKDSGVIDRSRTRAPILGTGLLKKHSCGSFVVLLDEYHRRIGPKPDGTEQ
jgi:hypothetical protein